MMMPRTGAAASPTANSVSGPCFGETADVMMKVGLERAARAMPSLGLTA
jgi:hypothetical protein